MLKNTSIVTIFLILSSVLGFIAQIVYASSFGAAIEMDIYFKILSVPTVITGIAPVVFSAVLIPSFAKYKKEEVGLNQFIQLLWVYVLMFSIFFTIVGVSISLFKLNTLIPNLPDQLKITAVEVTFMVWVGSGFSLVSGFLAAVLNYQKKFIKVAWTSILPPLLMLLFVLISHKYIGIRSISVGFILAFFIQFVVFYKAVAPSFSVNKYVFKSVPNVKQLLKQIFLVIFSLIPFTIFVPIAYYWASFLPEGSIAYLGYSQSFAGFLSVATSMGIAIVSFPNFADEFAMGNGTALLLKFERLLRIVLIISIFAASVFISLRLPILSLFYERGEFTEDYVKNLSSVIPWYLAAAVSAAGLNLLRTFFYSTNNFKQIAILGIIMPVVFFILAGVLKDEFSFVGIGMANAFTFIILFFSTVFLAKNKESKFLSNNFFVFIIKIVITSLIAGISADLCFSWISNYTYTTISIIISSIIFTINYLLFSKYVMKQEEVNELVEIVINHLNSMRKK